MEKQIIFRGEMGHKLTKSLFLETSYEDKTYVIYTLKDRDHPDGYKSLYRLYMDIADPTEYEFAQAAFEGWEHWQMVANAPWFKEYIAAWRKELEIKLRSQALRNVKHIASDDTKKSYLDANKFLLQGGWVEGSKKRSGRPTKEEIKAAASPSQVQAEADRVLYGKFS